MIYTAFDALGGAKIGGGGQDGLDLEVSILSSQMRLFWES